MKFNSGNNILYGKQEPIYRKTDTFFAFANAMCWLEKIENNKENHEFKFHEPIIF